MVTTLLVFLMQFSSAQNANPGPTPAVALRPKTVFLNNIQPCEIEDCGIKGLPNLFDYTIIDVPNKIKLIFKGFRTNSDHERPFEFIVTFQDQDSLAKMTYKLAHSLAIPESIVAANGRLDLRLADRDVVTYSKKINPATKQAEEERQYLTQSIDYIFQYPVLEDNKDGIVFRYVGGSIKKFKVVYEEAPAQP